MLLVFGVNHKTSPLMLREKLLWEGPLLSQALHGIRHLQAVTENAIISTCNRTEVMAAISSPRAIDELRSYFVSQGGPALADAAPFFIAQGRSAAEHVLRLAAGLESLVVGEYQVLGQLKAAFYEAQRNRASGPILNRLYHHAVAVGKQARSKSRIGAGHTSVPSVAVDLASRIFSDFDRHPVLVLGAGEMAELVLMHLREKGVRQIRVINRTPERAQMLAAKWQGKAHDYTELAEQLVETDIFISSTGAPKPLVDATLLQQVLRHRGGRPLFIVDIAVPRDVDPAVSVLDDVYLYNIDDLRGLVAENLKTRQQDIALVEGMVDAETSRFMNWHGRSQTSLQIQALTHAAEQLRSQYVQYASQVLPVAERASLDAFTKQLMNQVLHEPINRIKDLPITGQVQPHEEILRQLFKVSQKEPVS